MKILLIKDSIFNARVLYIRCEICNVPVRIKKKITFTSKSANDFFSVIRINEIIECIISNRIKLAQFFLVVCLDSSGNKCTSIKTGVLNSYFILITFDIMTINLIRGSRFNIFFHIHIKKMSSIVCKIYFSF